MVSHDPKHVEVDDYIGSEPADNPVKGSLDIVVSVPDSIQIKMVDASILADYEVWLFISSILCNAVVGFLVAAFQAADTNATSTRQLFITSIVFFLLFLISCFMAFSKRRTLKKKGKDIKLKAGGIASVRK